MLFHRKILFLISTVAVVITLLLFVGCNKNPETTTDIETTQVTVTTTPSTTEFEWPLDIPYPEHSENTLKDIIAENSEDFEYDTESFVYISYFGEEKTQYHIYYSYLYLKSLVVSAYVIYVDDGVIKKIEDITDGSISNKVHGFLKNETEESVLEWGFKSNEKLREQTVYDTFEYVLERAHSVFDYGADFFSHLKRFYFIPSWEDKSYVINYDYIDAGEIFTIPLPSKNIEK